jgi:hypothetical protein
MKKILILQLMLILIGFLPVAGQDEPVDSSFAAVDTLSQDFGLFTKDEILNLSLRFDLTEYMRKKPKEEYLKAILTYHINEKDSINKEIRLKSRGVARNTICNFPPLSLNFKKAGFEKEDLKRIDKIKMVTHCNSGNEEYLFKEYLIYKLYNVLTDYSFKVRLAKVDYISTGKKPKTIRSYAFLIEPLEMVAERTQSKPVEVKSVTQKNIIPEMMDRVAMFNYMIGNTDWSVAGQHNAKVVSIADLSHPGMGVAIPYDFDYAGLVDAHYAIPTEGLGLESVRQRRYLGNCRSDDEFRSILKQFSDKKQEFYKIINDFTYLNEKSKTGMISYLDEFFANIEKPDFITVTLQKECKP